MISTFAHAGEIHETAVETTAHALAWYVQLPLAIFIVAGFYALLRLVIKSTANALLILSLLLLIAGFTLFSVAPLVSATAITVGMVITLLVTLVGLGQEQSVVVTASSKQSSKKAKATK